MDLWRALMCLLFRRVYVKYSFSGDDRIVAIRWHDGGLWFWAYGEEYRLQEDGVAMSLGGRRVYWMRYTPPMVAARPMNFDIQQIRGK
jgi:hypothetical protein